MNNIANPANPANPANSSNPANPLYHIDFASVRIRPGKIVLDIDPLPDRCGSLHIPDTAREQKPTDISHTARIVAIGYGPFREYDTEKKKWLPYPGLLAQDTRPGDQVVFRMLMSDLNQGRIFTDVRRIDAVIEHAGS